MSRTALTRENGKPDLIDVLDRVLDKGIVIDAWVRVNLAGIDLLGVEARVVIASFDTYRHHAQALALQGVIASPPVRVSSERESDGGLKLVPRRPKFGPKAGS